MERLIMLLFFTLLLTSCRYKYDYILPQNTTFVKEISNEEVYDWYYKDIQNDSIPGISLYRVLNTVLKQKKHKKVVIALIDDGVDINHKDLKSNIWFNTDEVPNNGKDDDDNGYIDDINGWNFSGTKDGASNKFRHYDYVRMLKTYNPQFKDKTINDITPSDSLLFQRFKNAERKYKTKLRNIEGDIEYANNISIWKNRAKQFLSEHYNLKLFNLKILDSLKKLQPKDTILTNINILSGFITNGYSDDYIDALNIKANNALSKQLNIDFNEREVIGDSPDDINDIDFGNSRVDADVNFFSHATIVAGILSKHTPQIEIMSLAIPGFGDKHDKDIALAIRYAVDNDAKVINMSFGKDFSLNKKWIDDAIAYAEKNNVLIVTSAGNDIHNMDHPKKFNYPDDRDANGKEFVDNFIKVGGSTYMVDKNLRYSESNYGKKNVDVFAPAERIHTTLPNNQYKFDSGTSLASALTSQVAALIYSYYPNLTVSQVKQIILDSGIEYTFDVNVPSRKDKERTLPFNSLSKSGKIVNAYNAMIMADSITR